MSSLLNDFDIEKKYLNFCKNCNQMFLAASHNDKGKFNKLYKVFCNKKHEKSFFANLEIKFVSLSFRSLFVTQVKQRVIENSNKDCARWFGFVKFENGLHIFFYMWSSLLIHVFLTTFFGLYFILHFLLSYIGHV